MRPQLKVALPVVAVASTVAVPGPKPASPGRSVDASHELTNSLWRRIHGSTPRKC
jgi:hypothetical protein